MDMVILLAGVAIIGGAATILLGWSSFGFVSLGLAPFIGSLLAGGAALALASLEGNRAVKSEARVTRSRLQAWPARQNAVRVSQE